MKASRVLVALRGRSGSCAPRCRSSAAAARAPVPVWLLPHRHSYVTRRNFCSDKPSAPTASVASSGDSATAPSGSFTDVPGVKGKGDKYAMVFTCSVCETRAAKMISKQAYHHGTVLLRCPGCENLHLVADHLGQFEEKGWTLENFLAEGGNSEKGVKRVAVDDVLELTVEDIAGGGGSSGHK